MLGMSGVLCCCAENGVSSNAEVVEREPKPEFLSRRYDDAAPPDPGLEWEEEEDVYDESSASAHFPEAEAKAASPAELPLQQEHLEVKEVKVTTRDDSHAERATSADGSVESATGKKAVKFSVSIEEDMGIKDLPALHHMVSRPTQAFSNDGTQSKSPRGASYRKSLSKASLSKKLKESKVVVRGMTEELERVGSGLQKLDAKLHQKLRWKRVRWTVSFIMCFYFLGVCVTAAEIWEWEDGLISCTFLGMNFSLAVSIYGVPRWTSRPWPFVVRVLSLTLIVLISLGTATYPFLRHGVHGANVCNEVSRRVQTKRCLSDGGDWCADVPAITSWLVAQYTGGVIVMLITGVAAGLCATAIHPPSYSARSTIAVIVAVWLQAASSSLLFAARWCESTADDIEDLAIAGNTFLSRTYALRLQYFCWGVGGPLAIICAGWMQIIQQRRATVLYDNCNTFLEPFGKNLSPTANVALLAAAISMMMVGNLGLYASVIYDAPGLRLPASIFMAMSLLPGIAFVYFNILNFSGPIRGLKRELEELDYGTDPSLKEFVQSSPPYKEATWAIRVLARERFACLFASSTTAMAATSFALLVLVDDLRGSEAARFVCGVVAWGIDAVVNSVGMTVLSGIWRHHPWPSKGSAPRGALTAELRRQASGVTKGVALEDTSPTWQSTVTELAGRGFTLSSLLDFYASLGGASDGCMSHFDPMVSTSNDVVRQAIIPQSLGFPLGRALASTWSQGERIVPTCIVTHSWTNLFCDLVAAMVAHAQGDRHFDRIAEVLNVKGFEERQRRVEELKGVLKPEALDMTFWLCCFSVNQHASICNSFGPEPALGSEEHSDWLAKCHDSVTGEKHPLCCCQTRKLLNHNNDSDECEMNKFDHLMAFLHQAHEEFSQLIAVDSRMDIFSRVWCIAELVEADNRSILQSTVIYNAHQLDAYYGRLAKLNIDKCKATRQEDKRYLLDRIEDVQQFNRHLQYVVFGARGVVRSCTEGKVHDASRIAKRALRSQAIVDAVDIR
eukprot:TRINITY_DN93616_c0_g1_i1.p1 TRINITY_DN93616_c0_g1~~TRINITY_DN93616_c0_g1_i1.p1  ORF type:complete len:1014 (-),score=102.69 TRINITY_DN93616_c0_g1_i1:47-3088(-)